MTFNVVILITEACASLAAAACWGTTVAVGSLMAKDLSPALKGERSRSIARWIVRASVFTAIAALCEAASDLYVLIR